MSLSPAPPEWGEVLERDVLDDAERVRADHVPARVVREPPPALRSPVPVGADLAVGKTGLSGRTCSRARRATALAPPLAALHRKLESRLGAVYGGVDYFLRPPRLLSRSTTGAAWAALFGALLEETTSDRVARGPSRAMNSVRVARDEAGARRRPQWAPIPPPADERRTRLAALDVRAPPPPACGSTRVRHHSRSGMASAASVATSLPQLRVTETCLTPEATVYAPATAQSGSAAARTRRSSFDLRSQAVPPNGP
jgi:hypothetical protein